jgi:hypothetical protein
MTSLALLFLQHGTIRNCTAEEGADILYVVFLSPIMEPAKYWTKYKPQNFPFPEGKSQNAFLNVIKEMSLWELTNRLSRPFPHLIEPRFPQVTCFAFFLLHAYFFFSFLLNPEDGGDMFLWNFGWLSANYMALYPKKYNYSKSIYISNHIFQW